MTRFHHSNRQRSYRLLGSVCLFLAVLWLFLCAVHSFSEDTHVRQKEALEEAILHSITYCYSIEGAYPESLDYLKEHYGLTYNEELFYVDYRISGSNLLPDVTIIEKGE